MPLRHAIHPVSLPAFDRQSALHVRVWHASTPVHLAVFIEQFLFDHPHARATIHTYVEPERLVAHEDNIRLVRDLGRIEFAASPSAEPADLVVLLHSVHAPAGATAPMRRGFARDRSPNKFIIGGDGLVWRGTMSARVARALLRPLASALDHARHRGAERAVAGGLERFEQARVDSTPGDNVLIARRPMTLWGDLETGSLHREPELSDSQEQALYDAEYHGTGYFDHRMDWGAMLLEYQERRWDNLCAVVPESSIGDGIAALDVGCGTGGLADLLRQRGMSVTAIERSPQMIDACQRNFPEGIDFRVASVEDLLREHRRFSLVTLSHVLEHIPEPRPFLASIAELLEPDGVLYIEVPLFVNRPEVLELRPGWIWQWDHYHEFTARGLESLVTECGFRLMAHDDSLGAAHHEPYQFLAARPPATTV